MKLEAAQLLVWPLLAVIIIQINRNVKWRPVRPCNVIERWTLSNFPRFPEDLHPGTFLFVPPPEFLGLVHDVDKILLCYGIVVWSKRW
jgi:hypothetical protein